MLKAIGVETTADLFVDVPEALRFPRLDLPTPMSELDLVRELQRMSGSNANALSHSIFLGAGAYNHFVPAAVDQILRRGEFYTAYTPYQPEISQGTLQAVFEYQSLITALTGMEIANASHYDGATAIAEAAIMALNLVRNRKKIVVARSVNPQYRAVLRTYMQAVDVPIVGDEQPVGTDHSSPIEEALAQVDDQTALLIVQSPDFLGRLHDLRGLAERVHAKGALLCVHFDPIALGLFQTPAEAEADIATAEAERDTAIKRAQASKEARIAEAVADQEKVIAETASQTRQAEAVRDLEQKRAEYDATVKAQQAQADKAYEIQANIQQQRVVEEQVKIEQVRKQGEVAVQEAEILRREKELIATVLRSAQTEKQRIETQAEELGIQLQEEEKAEEEEQQQQQEQEEQAQEQEQEE